MRTKTLVLTAACAVIGAVAASAQSVYSVNAVGYVNVTVPKGLSILANPLSTTTNVLSNVLATLPDNTLVYVPASRGGALKPAAYYEGDGWDNPNYQVAPGTGFWINNQSGAAFTVTFVGEVVTGTLTNSLVAGLNLVGSIVPQSGKLQAVLGYTPSDMDQVYLNRNGHWDNYVYYEGDGWDGGNDPVPNVGEGFYVRTSAKKNWVRTFTIN